MTTGDPVSHEAPELLGILGTRFWIECSREAGPGSIFRRRIVGQMERDFPDGVSVVFVAAKVLAASRHTIFGGKDGTPYVLRGSNSLENSFVQFLNACMLVESAAKCHTVRTFSECKGATFRTLGSQIEVCHGPFCRLPYTVLYSPRLEGRR